MSKQIDSNEKSIEIHLIEEKNLEIINGNRNNLLFEGENLFCLQFLEEDYKEKIDVICIDPPYNTGMISLTYDDNKFLDRNDSNNHNKWLTFIQKRFKASYILLASEGVMFINIDEHEIANLLLLCYDIFGKKNVDVLIWPKTDPVFDQNRIEKLFHNIKIVHEYILVCFKNKALITFNLIKSFDNQFRDMETIMKGFGTTSSAKDELYKLFGDRNLFQTPKPMRLLKELVRAASKKDSIILDFFAGSGTTGHAVMDLNKEDGGDRRFILVNNNENEICRNITYPRLKKVIEEEDYKENLKYFKLLRNKN
ncbi:MAG: Type III restriction-modification system EcoPI enzyme mod [Candidatus Heimdallarchaeota archaeon LC_3]|nr:MAG: Type III restriction-modification system EcoPI enzyme mod [Candidatus Heimdallarchaeota archaeon LC_3]